MIRLRWWGWAIVAVVLLGIFATGIYFLVQAVRWRTRADDAVARAKASAVELDLAKDSLDQFRHVTDSLRTLVQVRDTVLQIEIDTFLQKLPKIIGSVDSAACAPVIGAILTCTRLLDSARNVSNAWKKVALRDSAQVSKERAISNKERARGDSVLAILDTRPRWILGLPRPKCVKGAGGGYNLFPDEPIPILDRRRGVLVIGFFCGF